MANTTSHFSKFLVEKSYDRMASRYNEWTAKIESPCEQCLDKLSALIPKVDNPGVLERGCGAGIPCTKRLLEHGCTVTANDISSEQLRLAKQNLGSGYGRLELSRRDMMELDFPNGSLDAVVAFYSIIHLPRIEQVTLLTRMQEWLKSGGHILINLRTKDMADNVDANWLGDGMYWSRVDTEGNKKMVLGAGFKILVDEVIEDKEEEDKIVPFVWIFVKKPKQLRGKVICEREFYYFLVIARI
jgi:ubiquinone/menaquinone biosynthesis C-methylase UbiE